MLELIVISLAAFLTALLTFFSGFGLGTVLMPVFALFFPVDVAIALTGVVHLSNNLFKMALVGKMANRKVLIRFGIPAVLASFAGAWVLVQVSDLPMITRYTLWGKVFEITPLKLIIAVLLLFFSVFEVLPHTQRKQKGKNRLILGGTLSGFFGGLAGIQGALRRAFLIKSGLSKESYIATGVIIASFVDITRLSVYATRFKASGLAENAALLIFVILAAIGAALTARLLLHKITFPLIPILITIMSVITALALGVGLI